MLMLRKLVILKEMEEKHLGFMDRFEIDVLASSVLLVASI